MVGNIICVDYPYPDITMSDSDMWQWQYEAAAYHRRNTDRRLYSERQAPPKRSKFSWLQLTEVRPYEPPELQTPIKPLARILRWLQLSQRTK
jgi:hypothetical protein